MTRIAPDVRAVIGDELADALELPIEQRAAAILAMNPLPTEPAFKLPVVITNLRVSLDFSQCPKPRKGT